MFSFVLFLFFLLFGSVFAWAELFFIKRRTKGTSVFFSCRNSGFLYAFCHILMASIVLIFLIFLLHFIVDDCFLQNYGVNDELIFFSLLCLYFIRIFFNIKKTIHMRRQIEQCLMFFFIISTVLSIFVTVGIVVSLFFSSIKFFEKVPIFSSFLLSQSWNPENFSIGAHGLVSSGNFGILSLLSGTILISIIAMCVFVPFGFLLSIYIAEYTQKKYSYVLRPLFDILAGIPTVVYGFFASVWVAPFLVHFLSFFGLRASFESALAAGLVMGIMVIPFISSLSIDALRAVPINLRDGAYALGSTKFEIVSLVVLPAALPDMASALLLAISRVIGETMIVVMAAGSMANMTFNPLHSVTTITVQIVNLLTGDQPFGSTLTLAAYALSISLFFITLFLNLMALYIIRWYRGRVYG